MRSLKQEYPSWRYHPTLPAIVIKNELQEPDADEGWRDVPYTQAPPPAVAARSEAADGKPCLDCAQKDADMKEKIGTFDSSWAELSNKHQALQKAHDALQKRYDTLTSEFKALSVVPPKPPKAKEAEPEKATQGA